MRKIDWQEQLLSTALLYENKEFEWGVADCCMFVADAVKAMADIDMAADVRGKYKTELGSKRVLARLGGLDGHLDKFLTRTDLNHVQRGDVVMVQTDNGPTLGMYWSGGNIWMQAAGGVQLFMDIRNLVTNVWRV